MQINMCEAGYEWARMFENIEDINDVVACHMTHMYLRSQYMYVMVTSIICI